MLRLMICQYTTHICEPVYSNYIDDCSWTVTMYLKDFILTGKDWSLQLYSVMEKLWSDFRKTNVHYSCIISHIGNKLTLETRPSKDGIDIRQELLKFHSTYYSSNLMGLCVLGRGKSSSLPNVMFKCCKNLTPPSQHSFSLPNPCAVNYSRQQSGTKNASHVSLGVRGLNHNISTAYHCQK